MTTSAASVRAPRDASLVHLVTETDEAAQTFAEVWERPGLSRRDRRWVTLACVAAQGNAAGMRMHIRAGLEYGDASPDELFEFVLQFALYCGMPSGSHLESEVHAALAEGQRLPSGTEHAPVHGVADAAKLFEDVMLAPAPEQKTPYFTGGVFGIVFGRVWASPVLDRRSRRLVALTCSALIESPMPLRSHVIAALRSGDLSAVSLRELALHLACYAPSSGGQRLDLLVTEVSRDLGIDRCAETGAGPT